MFAAREFGSIIAAESIVIGGIIVMVSAAAAAAAAAAESAAVSLLSETVQAASAGRISKKSDCEMRFIPWFQLESRRLWARGVQAGRILAARRELLQDLLMTSNPGTPETILRDALRFLLVRDLRSLYSQVAAYPDDGPLWLTTPGISNSAGNLVLHIVGNLRHFFGATLGSTGYVRNRASEFESRDLSREDLCRQIEATIEELETTLQNLDPERLGQPYPIPIADRQVRTGEFLAHLAVHLTYHLGQVDYHRRILTANPSAVENVAVKELPLAR